MVESPWDFVSLAVGVGSFGYNLYQGNYTDAAIDLLGIAADTAALLLPGVPGGAGIGIKVYRAMKVTVRALQAIDRGVNVVQGLESFERNAREGNYGWAAVSATFTMPGAKGLDDAAKGLNRAIRVSEEVAEHQKILQKPQEIFEAKNNPQAIQEIVQDTAKAQKAEIIEGLRAKESLDDNVSKFPESEKEILDAFRKSKHTETSKRILEAIDSGELKLKYKGTGEMFQDTNSLSVVGYSEGLKTITINYERNIGDILTTIVHEGQHELDILSKNST